MALKVSLLVSACVLVATSAVAQSQEIRRGPAPAWAVASSPMPGPETPQTYDFDWTANDVPCVSAPKS